MCGNHNSGNRRTCWTLGIFSVCKIKYSFNKLLMIVMKNAQMA